MRQRDRAGRAQDYVVRNVDRAIGRQAVTNVAGGGQIKGASVDGGQCRDADVVETDSVIWAAKRGWIGKTVYLLQGNGAI